MKVIISFAVLLLVAAQQSCNLNDTPLINSPKVLWKTSLSDGELIGALMHADIQYNGGVLLGGMNKGRCLYFLDVATGEIKWKWNDYISSAGWLTRWPLTKGNLTLISDGRELHCINLTTGQTAWKRRFISGFSQIARGINDRYYIPAENYMTNEGVNEGVVISGNLLDGANEEIIIRPEYTRAFTDHNNSRGNVFSLDTVKIGNDEGLIMMYWDPMPNYKVNIFLALYNLTSNKWIYDKQPFEMNSSFGFMPPVIFNGFVINAVGKNLQCNNILTGEIVWTQTLSDLNSSEIGLADGKLIVTTQDRITHCIDPSTGKELWALTTSGNPGIVRELNGIAYFVGGNAKLFAIDVAAGKILWQFSSPDEQLNSKAFWQEGVRVVPGSNGQKGKVIVSSYLNGHCYEAIR